MQRSVQLSTGDVTTKFLGGFDKVRNCVEFDTVLKESFNGSKQLGFIPRTVQNGYVHDFIQIPCGKCIGCRMDYSRSWADRMTYHVFGKEDTSWFVTLTYDDVHLEDLEHSDNYDLYSLNYDDMSAFIKNLRNKFRDCSIDFYFAGEYGDLQFRPHFHLILYGVPLDDLELWKVNDQGDPIYTSEMIHSIWRKGICSISPYNWRSAAYTARYVEKKRDGRLMCEYTAVGLEPEKCRCSRRPGIAYQYYEKHAVDLWNHDGLSVDRSVNSSGRLGLPRYFRKLNEKFRKDPERRKDPEKRLMDEEAHQAFLDFEKRSLERSNILNPFKIDNSSFDLDRIQDLLRFEEREVLSRKENRKL